MRWRVSGVGWRAVRKVGWGVAGLSEVGGAKVTGADPPFPTGKTPSPRPRRLGE